MKIKKKTKFFDKLIEDVNTEIGNVNAALQLFRSADTENGLKNVIIDGTIQRYENLFTKVVDLLKFSLINEGIETMSPRQIIQESARMNWISDLDFWLIALDARTSTMNRTTDVTEREFINIISKFAVETDVIVNLLLELNNGE